MTKTVSIKDITTLAKGICKVVNNLEKDNGKVKYGIDDATFQQRSKDVKFDRWELRDQLEKLQTILLDEKHYQKELAKYL